MSIKQKVKEKRNEENFKKSDSSHIVRFDALRRKHDSDGSYNKPGHQPA